MKKRSFEHYCDNTEQIENYELAKADNFKGWHCHHRLETHTSDGEKRLVDITKKELIALDMYYHRPAEELIFMPRAEHRRLHMKGKKCGPFSEDHKKKLSDAHKGMTLSEETKRKLSETMKGSKHPMFGKHCSEETKKKISEALKGQTLSEETKRKMSETHKGKNNPMYGQKHSEESKRKMSEAMKGKPAWNKGMQYSEETRKKISAAKKGKHWKLVDGKRVWY